MTSSYFFSNVLALILVLAIAFFCCCSSMASTMDSNMLALRGGNETDRLALLAIKAQIHQNPNRPVMSSWNKSTHFCNWHGVTCSRRHLQRVIKLNLTSLKLSGSISPHIGNLSFLRDLSFYDNSFTKKIPPEIGHLRRLRILRLENNSLSGPIPANISNCFKLIILDVSYNMLGGNIPAELGSLSKLEYLSLLFNNLTGEIPPSLGNLSSLGSLDAYSNNLVGSIPSSLGQLKKLKYFSLESNKLSGTIPPSIYNISSLLGFIMGFNQIQGSIPPSLFRTLSNLQYFCISDNQLTGSLPLSISNATNLVAFYVEDNKLTGQVPNLQKLRTLAIFYIAGNHLGSGSDGDLSFFSDLTNATQLVCLAADTNNFGGMLPASVSNLSTNLAFLDVHKNRLHGSIPAGIVNLVNMKSLALSGNMFTGNIPTDIGKLSGLGRLSFQNNRLSGSLPSSLGNLTSLVYLEMQGNNFNGTIPTSLGECHSLLVFDLSRNNLSGHIPPQVIGVPSLSISLNLSENRLSGSLPLELGELKSLGELDLSNNMISGKLPSSLGSCLSLEILLLQGNFFDGSIPSAMVSLRGIRDLDLSRNNLSGEIPEFLAGFRDLEKLNLSFNDFWGAVPIKGVFNNASATSVVGNTRLCGGISDLHLPKCKSKESTSRSMKLTILLVSAFTLLGIAMLLTFLFLCFSKKKCKVTSSSTFADSILQVSYNTLLKATDGFSATNLIGAGSFGSVYKGVLGEDGAQLVAVKVFDMLRRGASKSFLAECEALRNIRHRNLVPIITACSSVDFRGNDFKALVYEFMENGSLEEWLHPTTGTEDAPMNLSLVQRLDIAIDVACALDYLHNHCETPIVHCDLKPSNVLLDNDLTGHVADFGLARFLSRLANNVSANQSSSIGIRGTVGYAAPEYGMGSELSTYGDVYSFGILLLEMFAGKRPTDHMFVDGLNLHKFVKRAFPERVSEIADSSLVQVGKPSQSTNDALEECLSSILGIGVACSVESPTDRENIGDAVSELKSIRATLVG
ncbi:probable LRR receptor-like serine/threonine-protein kinase At3g47570 [Rosa rugosa]|uniref:probable LRR receptor-like serine/threonine-protein kinase At3g47570 n=1 Tax=Rosa rugosa TaxID=74645 RepID=UPI002B40E9CA|nr:probable LRR receptor-like serine/threonine-protein kinase At3g47570 [Rosa rugosa]XP_062000855.1 probable LRR receptor-like serine/threonine-protein kinase At3g47570 [Rosa rugosa]XP_062000856.1 probable LRR receptor-like serine/threonine-protein kinase At3g47570 [Rosa rugosa]XP_062000857.1 probable LRR receptor-like serine/threonine-protein kinase At3g47570 [Rosa rugosa]XP_062000859.1 probable LRR receptor-like serine/threonine-protein kinase At3g47570 [Rosa rugosa]XP_062000860.1 probable L